MILCPLCELPSDWLRIQMGNKTDHFIGGYKIYTLCYMYEIPKSPAKVLCPLVCMHTLNVLFFIQNVLVGFTVFF